MLAIFKFDRMEWAIEKCTELGVSRIVPVITRRTDAHLGAAAVKRVERWRRIALQASEQSRRATPPEIAKPIKLQEAASLTAPLRIVLAESERQTLLIDLLASHEQGEIASGNRSRRRLDGRGVKLISEAGWSSASLGSTILRAETAAIAATAITVSELAT